jgi:hypothetical protein
VSKFNAAGASCVRGARKNKMHPRK